MTGPAVEPHDPGTWRELDALIAEKVFGWEWKLDQDDRGGDPISEVYRVICDPRLWGGYELLGMATGAELARIDRPYNGQNPPHYSTDITAAWEVVVEVQRQHPGWRFSLLGGDRPFGYQLVEGGGYICDRSVVYPFGWHARFFGGEDPTVGYPLSNGEADADTAPLAICLAALKAVAA